MILNTKSASNSNRKNQQALHEADSQVTETEVPSEVRSHLHSKRFAQPEESDFRSMILSQKFRVVKEGKRVEERCVMLKSEDESLLFDVYEDSTIGFTPDSTEIQYDQDQVSLINS